MLTLVPLLLQVSLFLVTFGFGLLTTPRAALLVLRQPGQLLRIAGAMNVSMPALALAAAVTFELDAAVRVALVTLAASPVPPLLPNRALKAGGQADYVAGLMVASSLLSVVFIPLFLHLCSLVTARELPVPALQIVRIIAVGVLLPLLLGAAVCRYYPSFAARWAARLSRLGMLLLLALAVLVLLAAGRSMLGLLGNGTLFAFVAFAVTGLLLGHLLGGPHHEHSAVLAVATATRHPGIALTIAHACFPGHSAITPALLLYLLVSQLVAIPYFRWLERRKRRSTEPDAGAPAPASAARAGPQSLTKAVADE
jgi:BASS family bile acid:Na+ symporter